MKHDPHFITITQRAIRVVDVQNAVAELYGLPPATLSAPDGANGIRERRYARPRQVAMYLARQICSTGKTRRVSFAVIGRKFGNRDHTTVLHGYRAIQRRMRADTEERRAVAEVALRFILKAGA